MFSANDVKTLREKTGAGMLDCKKALEATNGNMEEASDWLREKGISKAAKKATRIAAEGLCEIVVDGNQAVILEVNSETDFVAKNEEFRSFVKSLGEALLAGDATTLEEALALPMDGETVNDKLIAITAKIGEKISFRRFTKLTKTSDESFGSYLHMGGKIGVLAKLSGTNEEVSKDVAMHACAMKPSFIRISDVDSDTLEKEKRIIKEQVMNEGKPAEIAEKMVLGRINKFYKEVCLEEQAFIKDGSLSVKAYVNSKNQEILDMIRYEVGEGLEKRKDDFAEEVMSQVKGDM